MYLYKFRIRRLVDGYYLDYNNVLHLLVKSHIHIN